MSLGFVLWCFHHGLAADACDHGSTEDAGGRVGLGVGMLSGSMVTEHGGCVQCIRLFLAIQPVLGNNFSNQDSELAVLCIQVRFPRLIHELDDGRN